jgi:hypothetical protein
MRRRDFIKLIGGAAAAWPLEIRAQQPAVHVGFLHTRTPKVSAQTAAFTKALVQSALSTDKISQSNIGFHTRQPDSPEDSFRYGVIPSLV